MTDDNTVSDPVAELERRIRQAGHFVTLGGLVNGKAAAAVLGISENTLRRWRTQGKGPDPVNLHGRYWYSIESLQRFLDNCRGCASL